MGAGGPESKQVLLYVKIGQVTQVMIATHEKLVTHLLRFMLRVHHRIAVTDSSQLKLELHNLAST